MDEAGDCPDASTEGFAGLAAGTPLAEESSEKRPIAMMISHRRQVSKFGLPSANVAHQSAAAGEKSPQWRDEWLIGRQQQVVDSRGPQFLAARLRGIEPARFAVGDERLAGLGL